MFPTLRVNPVNSPTLDHRMKLYSLAAAAASVSALALAQPAEAEVIITNKNIPIPVCELLMVTHAPCLSTSTTTALPT